MEPLNRKLQLFFDYLLIVSYSALVIIPLTSALLNYVTDFDLDLLSPLFFWILFKATLFALLQASVSVLLIALFSYYTVAYFYQKKNSAFSKRFLEVSGLLSFSLSPTLVALSLIFSFSALLHTTFSGFWAIVICHFLMNGAYFCSQFYKRAERFYAREGSSLNLYLSSIGATPSQKRSILLKPLFTEDFKSWFPQVFLWCFMSFAPIVLLAANTGQNTPELLLYYSLLNDPSGSRMLVIFLVTATLSFFLTRYAYRYPRNKIYEGFVAPEPIQQNKKHSYLLVLLSILLLFPFLFTFLSPLGSTPNFSPELLESLVPTLIIFVCSFVFSLVFGISSALCSKEIKLISFCNFISAPMLLLGFFTFETTDPSKAYPLIALGALLALVPWAHRRVRSFVDALSPDHKALALSLGMRNFSYFKNYLWPEVGPALWRLSLLFSLWSLGEYTFSKALLNRNSTLALFIEEKLRRYQFAEASLALSLSLGVSVVVATAFLWKGRKNAAL